MATTAPNPNYDYFEVDDDTDSHISTESEGPAPRIESIIAESIHDDIIIYLVKWQGCPLIRSSWESDIASEDRWAIDEWKVEKQKQAEGKSQPFDLVALSKLVRKVELLERQRRRLRSFRRQAQRIVDSITEK